MTKNGGIPHWLCTGFADTMALFFVGITVLSGIIQSGVFIGGQDAKADGPTSVAFTVAVGTACSLVSDVISEHNATLVPGVYSGTYAPEGSATYADGIGSTKLTVFCNGIGGYALYAVGYTGDTEGANALVGEATSQTIATGTATSGDASNWAMKISKVTDDTVSYNPGNLTITNDFDDFHAVPSAYTKVASYSSNTDATLGSQMNLTYAAFIQMSQVADTYVGKVKYTLVHPSTNDPNSYYVDFYANGGNGTMDSQKIALNTATTLSANTFVAPTGKTFDTWNTAADGTGASYANMADVTAIAEAGSTISLYAQWRDPITIATDFTIDDMYYMQDFTKLNSDELNSVIESMEPSTNYTLIDSRDNQEYTVAKLLDGKVWMTKNLNLAGGTALSASDTDITSEYIESFTTGGRLTKVGNTIVLPESAVKNSDNSNLTDSTQFSSNSDAYVFNSGRTTCSTSSPCYSYYSYIAVTAGSGTDISVAGYNAPYSICPKGWRLPTATTSNAAADIDDNWKTGDWYALATAYGANLSSNPYHDSGTFFSNTGPSSETPHFVRSNRYVDGSYGGSTISQYSSATVSGAPGIYYMYIYSTRVEVTRSASKRFGPTTRCLLRSD